MKSMSFSRKQFQTLFSIAVVVALVLTMAFSAAPASASACPAGSGQEEYHVRWGDTFNHIYALYHRYDVSLTYQALLDANADIVTPSLIRAGSIVCVPIPAVACGTDAQKITWGDTLSGIAWSLSLTWYDIMINAKVANPDWIFAGENLLLQPPPGACS